MKDQLLLMLRKRDWKCYCHPFGAMQGKQIYTSSLCPSWWKTWKCKQLEKMDLEYLKWQVYRPHLLRWFLLQGQGRILLCTEDISVEPEGRRQHWVTKITSWGNNCHSTAHAQVSNFHFSGSCFGISSAAARFTWSQKQQGNLKLNKSSFWSYCYSRISQSQTTQCHTIYNVVFFLLLTEILLCFCQAELRVARHVTLLLLQCQKLASQFC